VKRIVVKRSAAKERSKREEGRKEEEKEEEEDRKGDMRRKDKGYERWKGRTEVKGEKSREERRGEERRGEERADKMEKWTISIQLLLFSSSYFMSLSHVISSHVILSVSFYISS
jgi:hypothetical protein